MKLTTVASARSREHKFDLFLRMLEPTEDDCVLDVGVDPGGYGDGVGVGTTNFFEELYPWPGQIIALGTHDGVAFSHQHPHIHYVQADALDMPFRSGSFDIVFSNAVIEHVGDRHDQAQFADEVMRVGRRYFVTTPNRRFPLEVHTRLPFVHWLPDRLRDPLYRFYGKSWAVGDHNLLTKQELQRLFPEARIINLGMTLVAVST